MNAKKANGHPKHLTIRNVAPDLSRALVRERKKRGVSLNKTVLELLASALGLLRAKPFDNGLGKYAGTWTQEEFDEFQRNTAFLNEIDEEMWK